MFGRINIFAIRIQDHQGDLMKAEQKLSVIIPVFNEEGSLDFLNTELISTLSGVGMEFEIIYVDDGSTDDSFKLLSSVSGLDKRVKVVRLAKNYGQTLAMQAGIDYASGSLIIFIDGDLQNDPADIPKLLAKLNEGYDVVSGWRRVRRDSLFTRRMPSFAANKVISWLTGVRLRDYGCTLKIYRKKFLQDIRLYGQMHRFIPVYAAMRGASIAEIEVSHYKRIRDKSKYGLGRISNVILDLITARFLERYAVKPSYLFGKIGFSFISLGFMTGIIIVIRKIFFKGIWMSPMLFMAFVFIIAGIQSILTGLLAEILVRIYHRSSPEPTYLVKEALN